MPGGQPLRVGFISPVDSRDPDALSGMPYRMRLTLEAQGIEVLPLDQPPLASSRPLLPELLRRRIPWSFRQGWRTARSRLINSFEHLRSSRYEMELLAQAQLRADRLSDRIRSADPDVLFGCCISSMLYGLKTNVPIVYFSDATAKIINETYPAYRSRSPGYKRVCDAYERETMRRVTFAAFASERTRQSALGDYGLPAHRSRVVPMGAHITTTDMPAARCDWPSQPPSRAELRLCIIASDPIRKRVGLAVRATQILVEMGWNATLIHIGAPSRELRCSRAVQSVGPLRLSSSADRVLMAQTLATSHLMILPSAGEAFGIAPCEAAQFGRPSVVSAAGGLPEVVLHGRTGLVLRLDATAEEYAQAIAGLAGDTERYRRISRAAGRRAKALLNWESWADGIVPLLRQAAGGATVPTALRLAPVLSHDAAVVAGK